MYAHKRRLAAGEFATGQFISSQVAADKGDVQFVIHFAGESDHAESRRDAVSRSTVSATRLT